MLDFHMNQILDLHIQFHKQQIQSGLIIQESEQNDKLMIYDIISKSYMKIKEILETQNYEKNQINTYWLFTSKLLLLFKL